MPEGDTIHRAAATLRSACEGAVIRRATAFRPLPALDVLTGQSLVEIESRGKHLLMRVADGHVLHSHMGMTGSWHLYAPGAAWRKPAKRAAASLEFDDWTAVCFSPKTLELLSSIAAARHPHLLRLGPDLLSTNFDPAAAVGRFRVHHASPIGEALLNQTIVCGVGNVYKSEVLFLQQMHAWRRVEECDDTELVELLTTAQRLMRRNLDGRPRRTRFRGDAARLWVYGRQGEPCFQCATTIQMRRQGDLGRSTYWCPVCQPAPGS